MNLIERLNRIERFISNLARFHENDLNNSLVKSFI